VLFWDRPLFVVLKKGNLLNFYMHAHKIIINSLEKKLFQLIISRLDGEKIDRRAYQEEIFKLVSKGICGFIIFGGAREEVKNFTDKMQSISEIPLFIASDVERGVGQQIRSNTLFPCQMALAAAVDRRKAEDVSLLRSAVKAVAEEAKDVGINMPLIPVLDVNMDPDNPIICTRAFSDKPEDVAWFGSEYIRILEKSGLVSCAKHFPGHGYTSADSHMLLPVINRSYKDLMDVDIRPFRDAVSVGGSSIMVGHLSVPAVDDKPATISKKMITGILREKLGFDGLILTDALNMRALKDFERVSQRCIDAGADILLHPVDPDLTMKELVSAVQSRELSEERIESAINRILRVKARIGKIDGPPVDYQRHQILSSRLVDMSLSLVKDTPGLLPIRAKREIGVIFAGDRVMYDSSLLRKYFKNSFLLPAAAENLSSPLVGGGTEGRHATTLFAIFTDVSAWKGSSGISEVERDRIRDLIERTERSIVISFGSPYVLSNFEGAGILIAAYEATEQAQAAAIKCLEGRMDFQGRLPVRL
jgi:beta-N-acetylhexosaminidase